jgi:hypothetical protein
MDEESQMILLGVHTVKRCVSLFLVDREVQTYTESEFSTRATKSGKAFFEFIQTEGASLFTPIAWIVVKMF